MSVYIFCNRSIIYNIFCFFNFRCSYSIKFFYIYTFIYNNCFKLSKWFVYQIFYYSIRSKRYFTMTTNSNTFSCIYVYTLTITYINNLKSSKTFYFYQSLSIKTITYGCESQRNKTFSIFL